MTSHKKPLIGITSGDINGIGIELIIKTFADTRLTDICTPVVFANNKIINFYKKSLPDYNLSFSVSNDFDRINPKQLNIFNCWEEEVAVTPGTLNETGGKYAILSLRAGVDALQNKLIDGLVTSPIHKSNVQSANFNYAGHTPFLKDFFKANDVAMMMCDENIRIALVTEHVPLKDVAQLITVNAILSKLNIIHKSLQMDFGISKPRIAVLALNPHAGDEGLLGNEEESIIRPAIKQAQKDRMLVYGPYSADAFFARSQYKNFDAVLAMYHDQGLIPFKTIANTGINFTAGLHIIRTSPDHGVAFDIAGKRVADKTSFLHAIYNTIDIIKNRLEYQEQHANPLNKVSPDVVSKLEDEKIEEE